MKVLLILTLLIGGVIPLALSSKVLFRDQLLFSVKDQKYFLSDIRKMESALRSYRCIYPNSYVLDLLELDILSVQKINKILAENVVKEKGYIKKIKTLYTLISYLDIIYSEKNKMFQGKKKCFKKSSSFHAEIYKLHELNNYFYVRYSVDKMKVTPAALKMVKKDFPVLSDDELKTKIKKIEQIKMRQNALNYIQTIVARHKTSFFIDND